LEIWYNYNKTVSSLKYLIFPDMPSSKTKTSKGSTGSKKSSSASGSDSKKKSTKKTATNKKKTSSSKKETRSREGFKKTKIPIKVMNTPEVEEDRELQPVPETIAQTQESSNGIKPPSKEDTRNEKEEAEELQEEEQEEEKAEDNISDEEFFSDVSEEEDGTPEEPFSDADEGEDNNQKKSKPSKKPLSFNLYRKIAITFVILTLILLGGVAYFSLPSLEISIDPEREVVNNSIPVDIYNQDKSDSSQVSQPALAGVVDSMEIEEKKKFQSTGAQTIGKEIEGKVRIINNYSQDQPLVRTTRLLSPGGKLYRINEQVVVPAGGSVEVGIYTEEPSPEMAIDPTKFNIPGLWAGLQDDIYAQSEESFEYRVKIERYVQQSDIDKALEEIRDDLEEKAESEFGDSYKGKDRVVFRINEDSVKTTVDAEAGEEKDEFEVAVSGEVNIVALDNKKMLDLASRNLSTLVAGQTNLAEVDQESFSFDWNDFNKDKGVATINVSFSGEVAPSSNAEIVNKEEIVDLNKEQLVSYLEGKDSIKDYEIDFFPSFMQKVPNLSDRIEINIQTQ